MMRLIFVLLAALLILPAQAAEPFKFGISAGLTGYAATVDTAWRDGVLLAAEALNKQGGILGHPIEVVVEDNRSEPQEAVTAYRKMIGTDHVNVFVSGCVSAGNFAAAPMVVRAAVPMVLCSILPNPADQVKWAFTTIPPPRFEVEKRLDYLRDTGLKRFGLLHDPSPYANLQATIAVKQAPESGLTMVDNEQYRQDDSDLSVQISKINAAGGQALVKIGLGGSTLTAARNMKQLGLDMPMLMSLEDLNVFRPVAEVMGDKFFFVAAPSQVFESLPDGALKQAIAEFLTPWRAKYGDRDPNWAARGWDAVMLSAAAAKKMNSIEGAAIRDGLDALGPTQGTIGVYEFTAENHYGITKNPLVLARIVGGRTEIVK